MARWLAILAIIVTVAIALFALADRGPYREPLSPRLPEETTNLEQEAPLQPSRGAREPARMRPAEAPGGHNVHLLVVDGSGAPVPGASVVRWDADDLEPMGLTDDDGRLDGRIPERLGQTLLVTGAGYAQAHHDLRPPFPVEATVILQQERCLYGLVVDELNRPWEGIQVVAWPRGRAPPGRVIVSHLLRAPLLPYSESDSSGRFQLSELGGDEVYQLVAGGRGYVQEQPFEVLPHSRSAVRLMLSVLYGARIRVTALGGGQPVVATEVGTVGCTRYTYGGEQLRSVSIDHPSAMLTRSIARLHEAGFEDSHYDKIKLYAGPVDGDQVDPIEYTYCIAGYRELTGELKPRPVEGGLLEVPLMVEPMAAGFAELGIEVSGLPDLRPRHTAREATLYLFAKSVPGDRVFVMRLPEEGFTALSGLVPSGRTRFALGVADWRSPDWQHPIAEVDLKTDQPNVIPVDLLPYGGMAIALLGPDGREINGPARFGIYTDGHALVRYASYDRGPYTLYGLAAGQYYAATEGPYAGAGDERAQTPVVAVVPGEIARATCTPIQAGG